MLILPGDLKHFLITLCKCKEKKNDIKENI